MEQQNINGWVVAQYSLLTNHSAAPSRRCSTLCKASTNHPYARSWAAQPTVAAPARPPGSKQVPNVATAAPRSGRSLHLIPAIISDVTLEFAKMFFMVAIFAAACSAQVFKIDHNSTDAWWDPPSGKAERIIMAEDLQYNDYYSWLFVNKTVEVNGVTSQFSISLDQTLTTGMAPGYVNATTTYLAHRRRASNGRSSCGRGSVFRANQGSSQLQEQSRLCCPPGKLFVSLPGCHPQTVQS